MPSPVASDSIIRSPDRQVRWPIEPLVPLPSQRLTQWHRLQCRPERDMDGPTEPQDESPHHWRGSDRHHDGLLDPKAVRQRRARHLREERGHRRDMVGEQVPRSG